MNELEIFNFKGKEVRTVLKDGEVWFVAKDIASILGYVDTNSAISRHCKGTVKHTVIENSGFGARNIQVNIILERDIYRLIMSSKLPSAEQFEEWVVSEVLPSIRKNGIYATDNTIECMLNNPDFAIKLLTTLKEERIQKQIVEEKLLIAEVKIEEDKPKVIFADAVTKTDTNILVRELAKLITQNGKEIGGNTLYKYMRDNGYLIKSGSDYNLPTQKSAMMKIYYIKESIFINDFGKDKIKRTAMITPKGQIYFINKILKYTDKEIDK